MAEHPEAWRTVQWLAQQNPETVAKLGPPPGIPGTVAGALVHFSQALLDLRSYKADA